MSYYTYALLSAEGFHYTGHTSNLDTRLLRHQLHTTHYTKKGSKWKLMYSKEFESRSQAMQHEKWLKSGIGRVWLKNNVTGWSPP